MKPKPGGSSEPTSTDRAVIAAFAALLAGPAIAAPSYPAALDRGSLSAWLTQATDLAPDQVVAVTASVAAAVVGRSLLSDGRTEVLLRAVSLSPEATTRGGVLAWQVTLAVDCRSGEVRAGATTGYSSQMAGGEGVPLAPAETVWRRPPPATTLDSAWRAVCDPEFQPPLAEDRQRLASLPSPAPASRPATTFGRNAVTQEPASAPPAKPGRWVAQVVSSPDADDARHALAGLRDRYGEALQALETRVEPAQVRGRTVYRGVVAGFASSGAASEFCAALKRDGRDCLAR